MDSMTEELLRKKIEIMEFALNKANSFDIYRYPSIVKETIEIGLRGVSNIDWELKGRPL